MRSCGIFSIYDLSADPKTNRIDSVNADYNFEKMNEANSLSYT